MIADIAKELIEVGLAVSQPAALVVLLTKERLLALRTYKMLDVPVLSHSAHDSLLDGASARSADGNSLLVVAWKTVELAAKLTRLASQLLAASFAVEVEGMVSVAFVSQRRLVD